MKFAAVGISNLLIFSLVIWIMMGIFNTNMMVANITAYAIAWVNFFIWNKIWVFKSHQGNVTKEITLNLTAYLSAYLIQLGATLALIHIAGTNEIWAQYLGLLVFGASNFLLNRNLVFKQKQHF